MSNQTFSYCPDSMLPEIPYIEDVLFALGLSQEQKCYDFCAANHEPYIANVELLVRLFGEDIKSCTTKAAQRLVIAHAIVALCPNKVGDLEAMDEIISGPKYDELCDDDIKIVVKLIIMTSSTEDEINRRLRLELGYPYGVALTSHQPNDAIGMNARAIVTALGGLTTKNGAMVSAMLHGHDGTISI